MRKAAKLAVVASVMTFPLLSAGTANAYTPKPQGTNSNGNCVAVYSSNSTDNGHSTNGSDSVSDQAHEGLGDGNGRGQVISVLAKNKSC